MTQHLPQDIEHPFRIRPLLATEYVGREQDGAELWLRTHGVGESVVIVSEQPNGRTSLLRWLEHRFKEHGRRTLFLDAIKFPLDLTADALWAQLRTHTGFDVSHEFGPSPRAEPAPVLLIDDFHLLAERPGLVGPEFLGNLRAHTQTCALLLVASSRLDLPSLDRKLSGSAFGSPYLNNVREFRLGPLCRRDADALFDRASALGPADREFILVCTGAQPKLLHILASELLSAHLRDSPSDAPARRLAALQRCRSGFEHILGALWGLLPADERRCLTLLALAERASVALPAPTVEIAVGQEHVTPVERFRRLEQCLQRLPRALVRRALAATLPAPVVMSLPPDAAPDLVFFLEVAELLRRSFTVTPVLAALVDLAPAAVALELRRVITEWESPPAGSPSSIDNALDALLERQLVQPVARPPGWEIRPKVVLWWILDHARNAAWLREAARGEGEALVARFPGRFKDGAHPSILEVVA